MIYLHIINCNNIDEPAKSMFIEDEDSYEIAKLVSKNEKDNIIIVDSIIIDRRYPNKRITNVLYVFLNGNEDLSPVEKYKVLKK